MTSLKTKVGIAVIGTLLLGGSGTVLAMTAAHGQLPNFGAQGAAASPTAHTDDSSKDDKACTGTPTKPDASPTAHSDDSSDSSHASPTAHSGDDSPRATSTAGHDDQEGNEHESAQDEQNETECEKSHATRTPEPTERPEGTPHPEGTHTPDATGTLGGGN